MDDLSHRLQILQSVSEMVSLAATTEQISSTVNFPTPEDIRLARTTSWDLSPSVGKGSELTPAVQHKCVELTDLFPLLRDCGGILSNPVNSRGDSFA